MTALYEQYRPRTFDEVVGQDKAIRKVAALRKRGLAGRAYWISGQSGTGKTTIARLIAAEVASGWCIEEIDATDLSAARIREIERQSQSYGLGEKIGRAYIVNEAHGLNRAAVRQLLTTLEGDRIPEHVAWIFTTTNEGEQMLFDGCDDSHPLLSRCVDLPMARRDLATCLEWLHRREVELHVLDHGDFKMDLESANGRFMANILACVASFQSDQQSEAIRSALHWCKQNGLAYHGKCAIGKKRIRLPARKGERRGRVMDVWDEKECGQIREIVSRYEAGETLHDIGLDFLARDERTAMGARWVHPAKGYKRTGRKRTRPDDSRIYRAYHWYKRLRAEGMDLGVPLEGNGCEST